jgi:hypothetical protein
MPTVCHFSTLDCRLLNLNSTEQSENVYENKEPSSYEVEELRSWKPRLGGRGRTPTVSRSSTADSRLLDLNLNERSGNVYENKV